MKKLRELMKQRITADPDMWEWVQDCCRSLVDVVWEDVEKEIELNVELAWLKFAECQEQSGPTAGLASYGWLRRKVLRHYLPFDRSIFGKLRDPLYVTLTLVMLIPNAGFRVGVLSMILIFILCPGPPDEFQIINFILLSKGTQFITGGLLSTLQGALIYFKCFTWHDNDLGRCISDSGPGRVSSLVGAMADYLGSILLVWIAFLALPYSREHREERQKAALGRRRLTRSLSQGQKDQGGRLATLLGYDVSCFALSLLALVLLTWSSYRQTDREVSLYRHLQENIFWCKVLYSLLSMPFSIFTIQPLQQVLTHAAPTGFNSLGACVPFNLPDS